LLPPLQQLLLQRSAARPLLRCRRHLLLLLVSLCWLLLLLSCHLLLKFQPQLQRTLPTLAGWAVVRAAAAMNIQCSI
jgi:hypothetical protein